MNWNFSKKNLKQIQQKKFSYVFSCNFCFICQNICLILTNKISNEKTCYPLSLLDTEKYGKTWNKLNDDEIEKKIEKTSGDGTYG